MSFMPTKSLYFESISRINTQVKAHNSYPDKLGRAIPFSSERELRSLEEWLAGGPEQGNIR